MTERNKLIFQNFRWHSLYAFQDNVISKVMEI